MTRMRLDNLPPAMREQVLRQYPDLKQKQRRGRGGTLDTYVDAVAWSQTTVGWDDASLIMRFDGARLATENKLFGWNPWERNRYARAWKKRIVEAASGIGPRFSEPVAINVIRMTPDARPDVDNVTAKALIDGLREAGIISNDDPRYVKHVQLNHGSGTHYAVVARITPWGEYMQREGGRDAAGRSGDA